MKQKKTTRKLSEGQYKDTLNNWKDKAIKRSEENIKLRKRIKALTSSRNKWKSKCQSATNESVKWLLVDSAKAKQHQYSLVLVVLLLEFHKYGCMSLRGCRHCVGCMLISLGLTARLPSHNSIRNWLCKSGYYRINENENTEGDYVLYVDESIVFGSEKMLLILGIPSANIPQDRSLQQTDMKVLYIGASVEWKGESIEEELRKVGQNKRIKYVVSDQGNNLRKAYKSLNYNHIEDCTHLLANYLKALYDKDEDFELFRKRIGELRKSWNLSKSNSQYMPPTMRGKMRFANIFPCVAWAKKQLENWSNLSSEVQQGLAFLEEKSAFIDALVAVSRVFKMVCEKLKNAGFGLAQNQFIMDELAVIQADLQASEATQKVITFIANCKTYLSLLTEKSEALGQGHLVCSSDIIESYFGKFKTKINTNNRSGLTEFIFTIASFSQPFSVEEVKEALENVKLKDIKLVKKQPKTT